MQALFDRSPSFSFEFFPPKTSEGAASLLDTVVKLQEFHPSFVSVTYGAGGSEVNNFTCEVASYIKNKCGIESMAHLTCVNSEKQDVQGVLKSLRENNIENILALRGDRIPEITPKTDFKYASDLVTYIKENGDFGVSGACYPETHSEAKSSKDDILNLKHK